MGMWQDGFPVLSLGIAHLILFFPSGSVTHTVFSCPELGNRPVNRLEHHWCYLGVTTWREEKLTVSLENGKQCSVCWVPGMTFVSFCQHIVLTLKKKSWNKKNYLDFPFWFAELSVFTSVLTFLPFVIFMLTCSLAVRLHLCSKDNICRYHSNIEFLLWWALASNFTAQFSAKANLRELW